MLKKYSVIIAAALLLASCSITRDRSTLVTFASYQDYPDMWISPNDCPMPHSSIGHLIIEVVPAILKPERSADGVYAKNINTPQYERIGYDELLEMAVVEARSRGANGISNFKIVTDKLQGGTITAYYVEGLLIRLE